MAALSFAIIAILEELEWCVGSLPLYSWKACSSSRRLPDSTSSNECSAQLLHAGSKQH